MTDWMSRNRLQKKLPLMPGLPKFRLRPQILTEQSFLKARAAFELIIQAFAEGDRELLKSLLSEESMPIFCRRLLAGEDASEKLENTLIRIASAEPIEAYMDGASAHVTIKIVSEQINVTRDAKGEVVDGDPDHVSEITDIWTFARDTQTSDPNWELVATRSLE